MLRYNEGSSPLIRDAVRGDAEFIAAIWNRAIRDSVSTFNSVERSAADVISIMSAKREQGHPFLVSTDTRVVGFATYGQFRSGIGYARTMEHTIHLAPEIRRRGRGRLLMLELERRAAAAGVHAMWAGISGENLAAVGFHAAIGYREIARLPQVGRKFGRWFDLVLMQRLLAAEDD